jgi:hypothetical protein
VLKQQLLNLQVLASQDKQDATGRTKGKQEALLAFSILLSIGGFVLNFLDMRFLCRYARSAAGSVAALVSERQSRTGQIADLESYRAKCATQPVHEDTQPAAEESDHGIHTASKTEIPGA